MPSDQRDGAYELQYQSTCDSSLQISGGSGVSQLEYTTYNQAHGPCTASYADYENCTTVCKLLCDEISECRAVVTANQLQRLKPEFHGNTDRIMCNFYDRRCTPHATFTNPAWDTYFKMFNSFSEHKNSRCANTEPRAEHVAHLWGCNLSPVTRGGVTYNFDHAACADHCALYCISDADCVAFTIGSEVGRTSNSNVQNQQNDCVIWHSCTGLQDPQNINSNNVNWDTYVRPVDVSASFTTHLNRRCENDKDEVLEALTGCDLNVLLLDTFIATPYQTCVMDCAAECLSRPSCVAFVVGSEVGRETNSNLFNGGNDCSLWKTCSALDDPSNNYFQHPDWNAYLRVSS